MKFFTCLPLLAVTQALTTRQLYQFPSTSQLIENVAVLENGHLLLNTFDNAQVYTFDPEANNSVPRVIAKVPDADALTGIAQVGPSLYAVSAGISNSTDISFEPNSAKVALIDVHNIDKSKASPAVVVARLPQARFLNGMASLPRFNHIVLSVDSKTGTVYRVDTQTGEVVVSFQDNRLTPGPNPKHVPLGINGVKIFRGYLYFTSSEWLFMARFRIDDYGRRTSELQMLARFASDPLAIPDDFAIAMDGTAYVAARPSSLIKVRGQVSKVLVGSGSGGGGGGNGVLLDSPTAVALSKDEKTVFVVTSGGAVSKKGGQIVAVHL